MKKSIPNNKIVQGLWEVMRTGAFVSICLLILIIVLAIQNGAALIGIALGDDVTSSRIDNTMLVQYAIVFITVNVSGGVLVWHKMKRLKIAMSPVSVILLYFVTNIFSVVTFTAAICGFLMVSKFSLDIVVFDLMTGAFIFFVIAEFVIVDNLVKRLKKESSMYDALNGALSKNAILLIRLLVASTILLVPAIIIADGIAREMFLFTTVLLLLSFYCAAVLPKSILFLAGKLIQLFGRSSKK